MAEEIGASTPVGATENLRPHCQQPDACQAKTAKHCVTCTASIPEVSQRRVDASHRNRRAARVVYLAQRKTCIRCGAEFRPSTKVDQRAWDRRKYCGKTCAARGIMERLDVQARHRVQMRARFDDPDYRARHAISAACNAHKANTFSNRAKSGRTRTARILGWIPADLQTRYVRLRERNGADKAKELIRAEIEDRQLRALNHELAAAHLRRLAPVMRCNSKGKLDQFGTHWRYGSTVVDRLEIVRLAVRKGAQPERLMA